MKCLIAFIALCVLRLTPLSASLARTEIKWLAGASGRKIKKVEEKQYNSHGDLTKWVQYTEYGTSCESFEYSYASNQKAKSIRRYCSRKITSETSYTYDRLGRLVQEVKVDEKNHPESRNIHTYIGSSKNIAFTDIYFGRDKTSFDKTTFEYYPNGLLKREEQTVSGSWFQTREFKYDANKHLIYMGDQVDGGVGLVEYLYTYQNDVLIKDRVKIPGSKTEYHVYEILK